MNRLAVSLGASALLATGLLSSAMARPNYLQAFKTTYNTAQGKPTLNAANCALCHIGAPASKQWNVYGTAFGRALGAPGVSDANRLAAAFRAIEGQSNPAANQTFLQLISADKQPGHAPAGTPGTGGSVSGTWQPLFNGVNMEGLTKMNAGNWTVQDGLLTYTGGGNGWIRSNNQYTNYSLVVVWRYTEPGTGQNNDAGVFLKAPLAGNPWPGGPQLNMGPGQNFGTIGGTQGTRARFDLIKPNDWNTYQVTVHGNAATLQINGQTAWDMATGIPTGPGYVGIQCENRPFQVAQIWIMPLP